MHACKSLTCATTALRTRVIILITQRIHKETRLVEGGERGDRGPATRYYFTRSSSPRARGATDISRAFQRRTTSKKERPTRRLSRFRQTRRNANTSSLLEVTTFLRKANTLVFTAGRLQRRVAAASVTDRATAASCSRGIIFRCRM